MKIINHYETLGINTNVTQEEIKKAFRILSFKYHPDKKDQDELYKEKFQEINEAYQILSNPEERKKYDKKINDKTDTNPTNAPQENNTIKSKSNFGWAAAFVLLFIGFLIGAAATNKNN